MTDLFDSIVGKVASCVPPSIDSLYEDEIDEFDTDLEDGMEALGVKTKTSHLSDEDLAELTEEEIKALAEDGAKEEDVDDDLDTESVEELLENYVEESYDDIDPESDLTTDDLEDIEDDFDDDL